MLGFGLVGYFFLKIGVEPAPFWLGFVLGPMLEENFRRAMLIASGDLMVFVERPISAVLLACSALLLAALLVPEIRRRREVLPESSQTYPRLAFGTVAVPDALRRTQPMKAPSSALRAPSPQGEKGLAAILPAHLTPGRSSPGS
jgi:hypothetical protein